MRRILSIILVLSFVQSYGQKTQQSLGTKNTMVTALSDFKVDSLLFLPERDTNFTPHRVGAVIYKQSDSSLYYWAAYWRPMGGAFVHSVYKRSDSLFYQKGGAEYFVAKWGLRAFTVPTGLTATQIGDSISVTTALNGLIIGNGTGFSTAAVDSPLYYSGGRLRISKASTDSSGYLSYADWQAFNAKISPTRQVATSGSLTGGGTLAQDRILSLVNDNAVPGPFKYYGTNSVGTKGFFTLPSYLDSVNSVFGRTGHITAKESDYIAYYALLNHTHVGLLPVGGLKGQVLKKLSGNDYDVGWENDNLGDTTDGSSGGGIDTLFKSGFDLRYVKNYTTYTLPNVLKPNYTGGNGIKVQDSIISVKHITVTTDSNILIGTTVNDGHKVRITGPLRYDQGSDAEGDTWYRDGFGTMARLSKPSGLTKPVLAYDTVNHKPYWKEDEGGGSDTTSLSSRINLKQNISDSSTVDATRYWTNQNFKPLSYVPDWTELTSKPRLLTNLSQLNDSTFISEATDGTADTVLIAFTSSGGGTTVTGGSFSGTTSKTHTLNLSDGSTVSVGSFTDNTATINNNADNRLLTSDGTTTAIDAESDLTFSSGVLSVGGIAKPAELFLSNTYSNGINATTPTIPLNAAGRLVGNSFGGMILQGYSDRATWPGTRLQGFTYSTTPTGIAPIILEALKPGNSVHGYPLTTTDTALAVYSGSWDSAGVLLMSIQANGNMYVKGTVNGSSGSGLTINSNANNRLLTANGGTTSIDGETSLTWDGTTLAVGAAAAANNSLLLTDDDITLPNLTGVTFSPAMTSSTYGRFAAFSGSDGGMQVTGLTENVAGAIAMGVLAYSGSTAPTAPVVLFRSAKHNGTTGFTTLANTEIIAAFRNWTNADAVQFLGNGDVKTTGSLTTAAPTSGTAGAWKLGIKVDATVTLDTTKYIQVDIGGTLYKLALAQ